MVARLLWEQDAAGSNPVSPTATRRQIPTGSAAAQMGGFLCELVLGHPFSQHGVRSVTTTRSGVDESMQNGIVPITRPRASHGAFLCPRSGVDAWVIAPGIGPVTPRHICSQPWSPIDWPRAGSCWWGLRHPSHTEAWPDKTSGRSLRRTAPESRETQHAIVKRSLIGCDASVRQ